MRNQQQLAGRRIVALNKVADLFLEYGSMLTPEQIAVFDNLLFGFIQSCEAKTPSNLPENWRPSVRSNSRDAAVGDSLRYRRSQPRS